MDTINATPHVAQNSNGRRPAIDGPTARHRGQPKVACRFISAMAAYNLARLPKLLVLAA